jgi:ribosomal protein S18 acetylase RimI-like enzyme
VTASVIIRAAAADEAAALAAAHTEADYEAYAPLFGDRVKRIDAAATLKRWRDGLDDGDIVLAAVDGAEIVGMVHIKGDWMGALYLRASHIGQGLGHRLMTTAFAEAAAKGVTWVRFNVVENNERAIAFYEAHGAKRVGRSLHRDDDGDEWWEYDYVVETAVA